MNARIAFVMVTMVLTFPIAFWLYGIARTMCETVGFHTRASILGLVFGVCLPALATIPAIFVMRRLLENLKPKMLLSIILGAAIGLLAGSVLSEYWILVDEISFMSETASTVPYSRPRAWPNTNCSLVYSPNTGVHATD